VRDGIFLPIEREVAGNGIVELSLHQVFHFKYVDMHQCRRCE
jgi:hypothetical protein